MKLKEIIKGMDAAVRAGDAGIEISGISYDSRKVKKGHLFAALRGEKSDGRNFVADAVRNGAAAVLMEDDGSTDVTGDGNAVALIKVRDGREALARAAVNFYSSPSESLCIVGITGTNGKTTTSYILKSILESWGKKVGLIGTIQYMIREESFEAPHTTPESLEFQELLHRMKSAGCTHVVSEISSHALSQKRVALTEFSAGVFTNLTRDHLDFHKNMNDYFESKAKLFRSLRSENGSAIINADDSYGRKLASSLRLSSPGTRVFTYGLERDADFMATGITNSIQGLEFTLAAQGGTHSVVSPLLGLPNVYNVLSAAAAAAALGIPWAVILEGIRNSGTVKGRFEKIDVGQKFLAIVDYAHTEDALERLIYTARGLTNRKVITVFGCGGDRDQGKRPKMGEIATRLSDFVIITSDNPRSEKQEDIQRDILAGAARKNYLAEPDRKEAIRRAVLLAEEGDIVVVAGKGHETYQDFGTARVRFSDKEVLEEAIRKLFSAKQ